MRAFNPTASAATLIKEGLVSEELHRHLYRNLAARADLEPGSQQLVVGGIGSGKTVELRMAERWLEERQAQASIYFDVTAETDLSDLKSGALLASLGLHLISRLEHVVSKSDGASNAVNVTKTNQDSLRDTRQAIREFALGKSQRIWVSDDSNEYENDEEDENGHYEFIKYPGKLSPPIPKLSRDVESIREPLKRLISLYADIAKAPADIIVVCDGLDRLVTPDKFWTVVHQDCRILKSMRVSLIATAPLSILYGTREVADYFDRVHHVPAIPFTLAETELLESVLIKRGAALLLSSDQMRTLCQASGGVLRDLISLARDAAEQAYIEGANQIGDPEIASAISQLGTSYLRGLNTKQRSRLQVLRRDGSVDLTSAMNMELLATRRILEYSADNFKVHPSLLPYLNSKTV